MKFAALSFLICASSGTMTLNYCQRIVRGDDTNGDGCLEWNEFQKPVERADRTNGEPYTLQ